MLLTPDLGFKLMWVLRKEVSICHYIQTLAAAARLTMPKIKIETNV